MAEWREATYPVKGHKYKRLQRNRRVPGKKNPVPEYIYLGRADQMASNVLDTVDTGIKTIKRARRRGVGGTISQITTALVGVEDQYGRLRNSVLNRYKERLAAKEKAAQRVSGPTQRSEKGEPLAREAGTRSGDASSSQPDTPAATETPGSSETT
jgi:hypothetical protein